MKYQNLKAFQKHLKSAAPDHLCRVYLVAISDDETRTAILQEVIERTLPREISLQKFSPGTEIRTVVDALNSPSLFGGDPVIYLDEIESYKKKEMEDLGSFLSKNEPAGYLLLGSRKKTPLLETVEKAGVVLDMTGEKPWDKEKRLQEMLSLVATKEGKRLSSDAIPLLFERLGFDLSLLTQEIQKLCCFVGERLTIERTDIFRVSPETHTETLWKMAEEMIWDQKGITDPAQFYAMVYPLRSQLQLGCKILTMHEQKVPLGNWSSFIPKVWPKTLEKRSSQALRLGPVYFKKGLEILFKVELMSRTGSHRPEVLLDLFQTSLRSYG